MKEDPSASHDSRSHQDDEVSDASSALSGPPGLRVAGPAEVITDHIHFPTAGDADTVNLTSQIRDLVEGSGLRAGTVTVFVPGATGAVTTLEFEPGVVQDVKDLFDRLASPNQHYFHNDTHPDANGHAHVRAALLGPSVVIPFAEGRLLLGRWQEIAFVCFDNRPRERTVIVQILGVR